MYMYTYHIIVKKQRKVVQGAYEIFVLFCFDYGLTSR